MPRPRPLLVPSADTPGQWDVWLCPPGRACEWHGTAAAGRESAVLGLPARWCRTLCFPAPTNDRQLLRRLAWAQLEKRGLVTGAVEQASFDVHFHAGGNRGPLASVDVLTAAALQAPEAAEAAALLPHPRLYTLPERRLVVLTEHGRLLLCAGSAGELVHSQLLAAPVDSDGELAAELRIAAVALQEAGALETVEAVELWGDFPATLAQALGGRLGLPVSIHPRPVPVPPARGAGQALLPAQVRARSLRRRLVWWRRAAAAAVLVLAGAGLVRWHRGLLAVEAEAARLEAAVSSTAGEKSALQAAQEKVRATQERWSALKLALEPRRYPLAVLDGLTRCQPEGGVVLGRFEFKNAEVTATGSARTATEAYHYLNAVADDKRLAVMAWSMPQPAIAADGTATFELKGRMR